MAVRLRASEVADVVLAVELPAQTAPFQITNLVARHLGHRLWPQQSHPVESTVIEIELCKTPQVVGGAKDARMPGHPAERPRVLVVDLTPDHSPTDAILVLSRGDAWLQVSWRPVHSLIEVQR